MKTSESIYSGCIYFSSGAMARKIEKIAVTAWKGSGLSPSHAYLLMLVIKNPGIQPTNISKELQLDASTITRFIQKLENKKLLVRITEGKITNVYPAPSAKKLLPKLQDCVIAFNQAYAVFLSKKDEANIIAVTNNISDKLKV